MRISCDPVRSRQTSNPDAKGRRQLRSLPLMKPINSNQLFLDYPICNPFLPPADLPRRRSRLRRETVRRFQVRPQLFSVSDVYTAFHSDVRRERTAACSLESIDFEHSFYRHSARSTEVQCNVHKNQTLNAQASDELNGNMREF